MAILPPNYASMLYTLLSRILVSEQYGEAMKTTQEIIDGSHCAFPIRATFKAFEKEDDETNLGNICSLNMSTNVQKQESKQ